ncbi:MAG: S-adenosylmethionine:tRNA ribosyltransferase-isomerase [Rikenellaceae bacterium]|nr:S-adenosylmethionine:tRNA ribosyltransferase-isomerase [Rikenellaceae bacterium]
MKKVIPKINIQDYTYTLSDDKIAKYPLPNREDSRILIFKHNSLDESKFSNLAGLLPSDSLLIFNKTKVVPARLLFRKPTGAHIEIFCLEPYYPNEYNLNFSSTDNCSWIAVVGNAKKWKSGFLHFDTNGDSVLNQINLKAKLEQIIEDKYVVNFSWEGGISFSQVMEMCGKVPIPPYLNRDTQLIDKERYQTLYASTKGSVAAPTAGLHFSQHVLDDIDKKGIKRGELVLHVGAGTFLPVKANEISSHKMHSELFSVEISMVRALLEQVVAGNPVVAVGTTSVRTLESLYWIGLKCFNGLQPSDTEQWEPYSETSTDVTPTQALQSLVEWMESSNIHIMERKTRIIIVPGYKFRIVDILITNFHQPNSTLLLLIASFVGDNWKSIYNYALDNGFRFLSYGDSSVLFRLD